MSSSQRYERQLHLCIKRMHQEHEQMRLFRRFRFQSTRAESELAMLPPLNCLLVKDPREREVSKTRDEYEAAEEIYRQMLKRFEGDHNPTQPNVLRGLYNLGVVLVIYGKLEEGEKVFLRILEEIGGSLRPEDGITIARTLNNLAMMKYLQGKYQEAEMLLRRALHGQEQALDDLDEDLLPWLLDWCNNLAMTLKKQNKAKEAQDLQERIIEKVCEIFNSGDPYFNCYRRNLEWIQS
jgi:tetratricopeptide (TPR) repeat protein